MHIIIALLFLAFTLLGGVAVIATVNSPPVAACSSDNC
jgi:hypothetical protein